MSGKGEEPNANKTKTDTYSANTLNFIITILRKPLPISTPSIYIYIYYLK